LYVVQAERVAIEVTVPARGRVTILTVGPGESPPVLLAPAEYHHLRHGTPPLGMPQS
jgi:hypothetical protein